MNISENEVLDALRAAMRHVNEPSGPTLMELTEALGWPPERTRTAVKRMMKVGAMECAKDHRIAMDGRNMVVPVYRFAKKGKK